MTRKKSTRNPRRTSRRSPRRHYGWTGFLLLLLIIGIVFYLAQHRDQLPKSVRQYTPDVELPQLKEIEQEIEHTAQKAQKATSKAIEKTQEKAKELTGKTTGKIKETTSHISTQPSAPKAPSSGLQLEIPINTVQRQETILRKHGFTLSYSPYYRNPHWVAWELTRQETEGEQSRASRFEPDPSLRGVRVTHDDYTHSGYDRGHMAPAADMKWSAQAMKESFYTTNICPQNKNLNRGDWNDLEELSRKWGRKYGRIYIVCGPVYKSGTPKRLKKGNVAIPDQFFKAILIYNRKDPKAMGFLFDNKARSQQLSKYMVTVDSLERLTGLDFFSRVPDSIENKIEAVIPDMPF